MGEFLTRPCFYNLGQIRRHWLRNRKKITFTIAALLLSLLLLLTGLEIILRLSDVLLSHSTQTLLDYGDTWIDYREGVGEGDF